MHGKPFYHRVSHVWRSLFVLIACTACLCLGQIITSSIVGTITDPTGAAIPGAKVTIVQAETGFTRTVAANSLGEYRVVRIPAGTYTLTVEMIDSQTTEKSGQVITQQLAARIDFVMQV